MTFPHRIAALDLSLTGTGIAVHDPTTTRPSPIHTKTVDGTRLAGHARLHEILVAVADLHDYELVVIEDVFAGLKGDTAIRLAELHGLVKHWLWLRCIPYVLVNNTRLKQYVLGKGSGPGTTKEQVLLAVERRYGLLTSLGTNDEADALALLAMALDHYGAPLAEVPLLNRSALAKITGWPDLDPAARAETRTPARAAAEPARSMP